MEKHNTKKGVEKNIYQNTRHKIFLLVLRQKTKCTTQMLVYHKVGSYALLLYNSLLINNDFV